MSTVHLSVVSHGGYRSYIMLHWQSICCYRLARVYFHLSLTGIYMYNVYLYIFICISFYFYTFYPQNFTFQPFDLSSSYGFMIFWDFPNLSHSMLGISFLLAATVDVKVQVCSICHPTWESFWYERRFFFQGVFTVSFIGSLNSRRVGVDQVYWHVFGV